jgi:hypothetical protein
MKFSQNTTKKKEERAIAWEVFHSSSEEILPSHHHVTHFRCSRVPATGSRSRVGCWGRTSRGSRGGLHVLVCASTFASYTMRTKTSKRSSCCSREHLRRRRLAKHNVLSFLWLFVQRDAAASFCNTVWCCVGVLRRAYMYFFVGWLLVQPIMWWSQEVGFLFPMTDFNSQQAGNQLPLLLFIRLDADCPARFLIRKCDCIGERSLLL